VGRPWVATPGQLPLLPRGVVAYSNESRRPSSAFPGDFGGASARERRGGQGNGEGRRERLGASCAVSTTGIAGPDGAPREAVGSPHRILRAGRGVSERHVFLEGRARDIIARGPLRAGPRQEEPQGGSSMVELRRAHDPGLGGLLAQGARSRGAPVGLSWVKPENMHLTIRFLGDLGTQASGAPGIPSGRGRNPMRPSREARRLGAFPSPDRPRVLWAGLERALRTIAIARLGETRASARGIRPPDKPFRPHVTLARVRERAQGVEAFRGYAPPPAPRPRSRPYRVMKVTSIRPGPLYSARGDSSSEPGS